MRTLRLLSAAALKTAKRNCSLDTTCEHENVKTMPPGLICSNAFAFNRLYPLSALRNASRCLANAGGSRIIKSYFLFEGMKIIQILECIFVKRFMTWIIWIVQLYIFVGKSNSFSRTING